MNILSDAVSGYLENSSWIRRMFELGAKMKAEYGEDNVHDFSLGNPDLPAPPAVASALEEISARANEPFAFGYMPNGGYPWLREQLAKYLSIEQNTALNGNDVIITCGAAGALNAFFRAVLNPGSEVITFAPYFVEYGFYCENHGGRLIPVPAIKDTFALNLAALEQAINAKTRAVLINSPHNPTGVIYSQSDLTALAHLLENKSQQYGHPIWLISDEPYRFLTYDDAKVPAILPIYTYSVTISSLSKNMSMPGERIGYLAVAPQMPEKTSLMNALALTNRILGFVNPPVIGQKILAKALGSGVDISVYANRRDIMAQILTDGGYEFQLPAGAFYFFPKAPGGDDIAFVNRLLEEKILAVPGSGFGYPGHFRLAFCVDDKIIQRSAKGFANAKAAFNNAN